MTNLSPAANLVYVVSQLAADLDCNLDEALHRVHQSNLSKLVDGKPLRREDGKVLKGPNYQPPKLEDPCMTDLSPAAQAVRDAALATYDKSIPKDDSLWALDRASVVAALRAAADQVVPEPSDLDKEMFSIAALRLRWVIRDQLLAIAAELEGSK